MRILLDFKKSIVPLNKFSNVLLVLIVLIVSASASSQIFVASLNGSQSIPPNNAASAGTATVILNSTETSILVSVRLSPISSDQVFARIRNSQATILNLPIGNFSQSFAVNSLQVAELKNGAWFIEVGSVNFPNGEIRGRLSANVANSSAAFPSSNGTLDSTFGINGIVTTEIGGGTNSAQSVAIQSDGKIVVGGYSRISTTDDFTVARYNPDGSLDTSFNATGIVNTPIGTSDDQGLALILQPDGKILLAGQTSNGANFDIGIVRYNPDGTLDTTFSGDGISSFPVGTGNELVRSIDLQQDGKILLAGQTFNGANNDVLVIRLNSDGNLDQSFDGNSGNSNGAIVTAPGSGNDFAYGVKVQTDGKIVIAGYFFNGTNDVLLIRYNSDGVLDNSFDGDGIVATAVGIGVDEALSFDLQSDGKIVTAGCINQPGMLNDFLFVRYNPNGSIDTTFGTNGVTTVEITTNVDLALGMKIQTNGSIVAVGISFNGINFDYGIVRLTSAGLPDPTFDGDGRRVVAPGNGTDQATGVAFQADGKIVVVGRTLVGATTDFGIVRLGYGTNLQTNNGYFQLSNLIDVRFENATMPGTTSLSILDASSLPAISSGSNMLMNPRSLRSNASFSGDVLVKITLPAATSEASFNSTKILQIEDGIWVDRTANIPLRDYPSRAIYARFSSLSVFVPVSPIANSPSFGTFFGRVFSKTGRPEAKAVVRLSDTNGQIRTALTNPFGFYRFIDVPLGKTYLLNAASKRDIFAARFLSPFEQPEDLQIIAIAP